MIHWADSNLQGTSQPIDTLLFRTGTTPSASAAVAADNALLNIRIRTSWHLNPSQFSMTPYDSRFHVESHACQIVMFCISDLYLKGRAARRIITTSWMQTAILVCMLAKLDLVRSRQWLLQSLRSSQSSQHPNLHKLGVAPSELNAVFCCVCLQERKALFYLKRAVLQQLLQHSVGSSGFQTTVWHATSGLLWSPPHHLTM